MSKSYKLNNGIYIDDSSIIHKDTNGDRKTLKEILNSGEVYSTEEQRIGTYLGKPLYRKTIQIGKLPNNTETNYPHGISNLGSIVSIKPKWYDTFENKWFANLRKDSETIYISFSVSNANLVVEAKGTNWNARTRDANCTIEYTKTTD